MRRFLGLAMAFGLFAVAAGIVGCGSSKPEAGEGDIKTAATSLQKAMTSSSRAIDSVRGTRSSVERASSSLQLALADTGDAISLLTPRATSAKSYSLMLQAARDQRTFLQLAVDATETRSRSAAAGALRRSNAAGGLAADEYAQLARTDGDVAGLLPAPTAFSLGRLRDAITRVNRSRSASNPEQGTNPPQAPTTTTATSMYDWPGGSANTVILKSADTEADARATARTAVDSGLDAGVLYSSDFSSLRAGYWVVFSGVFGSSEDAARRQSRARSLGFSGAYVRFVSP